MSTRKALEDLLLIVEIHQKSTGNNFAWAEVQYAKELLAQPEPVITQTEAYKKGYLNAVNDLKAKIDNIFARLGVE